MRRVCFSLLAAFYLSTTGCAAWIAQRIVEAPGPDRINHVVDKASQEAFARSYGFERLDIPVGPPEASLAVTVIEPRDYGLEYDFHEFRDNIIDLDFSLVEPESLGRPVDPANGTVILLPGMLQSRFTMTFWGIGLAQRGYRAVLVDLRGHGDSTGRYLTYGTVEARDTLRVIEALCSKGILKRPVALLGASYGAVTAVMAAAQSSEIDAVVAMAPFADAPTSIDHLARTLFPYIFWAVSDNTMAEAIDRASRIADADLRRARAVDAMVRVDAPVLLIHGREDDWVPTRNSMELYMAAGAKTELMVIPGAGHMDLPMRYDEFSVRVFDWLERVMAAPRSRSPMTTTP